MFRCSDTFPVKKTSLYSALLLNVNRHNYWLSSSFPALCILKLTTGLKSFQLFHSVGVLLFSYFSMSHSLDLHIVTLAIRRASSLFRSRPHLPGLINFIQLNSNPFRYFLFSLTWSYCPPDVMWRFLSPWIQCWWLPGYYCKLIPVEERLCHTK